MTAHEEGRAPLRLLFVCTANIARSPYAERRARQRFGGHPVEAASAGIPGYPGLPMDREMAAELRARGGEPNGHISRSLTLELLVESDLVLTFEFAQRMRIFDQWPEHADKVLGLHQFADALDRVPPGATGQALVEQAGLAAQPDTMTWDFDDPYGRGPRAARLCADEIDVALARLVLALAARDLD